MKETFNPKKIEELKSLDHDEGQSAFKELVKYFIETTPESFSKMAASYYLKDFVSMRKEANTLAKNALSIGAENLSDLASAVELSKEEDDYHTTIITLFKTIKAEFEIVKEVLERY